MKQTEQGSYISLDPERQRKIINALEQEVKKMETKKKEQLFEKFKNTGSIEDYLEYSKYKRKNKENEEHHQK